MYCWGLQLQRINWEHWSTPHDETKEYEKFLEAFRDAFFYQHVNEPTRARGTDEPSLIDLILSNEELENQKNQM